MGEQQRIAAAACGLVLRIDPATVILRAKQRPRLAATLTNTGAHPLTLVLPGDGSRVGRRTPIIEWIFTPGGSVKGFEGCGNINELKPGEVFTLRPGETRDLGRWVAPLALPSQPKFHGVMVYTNEPDLPFRGVLLRPHDKAELARFHTSARCRAESNAIEFAVQGED